MTEIRGADSTRLQSGGVFLDPGDIWIVAPAGLTVATRSPNGRLHGARIPPFVQLDMTVHKREGSAPCVPARRNTAPHVTRGISVHNAGKRSLANVVLVMIDKH